MLILQYSRMSVSSVSGHRPAVVSLWVPEPDGGARVVPVRRDEILLQPESRPLVSPPSGRVDPVHVLGVPLHVSVQAKVINILEPYVTTREKGTGLGLAIVNKIVEEHGGEMTFTSVETGGTRVTMRFARDPLAKNGDGQHTG